MIEEAYVSYEVAKLLKEKGMKNIKCRVCYKGKPSVIFNNWICISQDDLRYNDYLRPSLSLAARWLREECGLHVAPYMSEDSDTDADGQTLGSWIEWYYDIYDVCGKEVCHNETEPFQSYEEAMEAGLLEALKMIEL